MSQSSGIQIGATVISGTQAVILRWEDHLPEHSLPGFEGGIVERVGSKVVRVELHGFTESGDIIKSQLSGYFGTGVSLAIPSYASGNWFALIPTTFIMESLEFQPVAGKSYPYYHWVVRGTSLSGIANVFPGGVIGVLVNSSGSWLFPPFSGIAMVSGGITYSQVLPVSITEHSDYSQVLSLGMSMHADYTQMLPIPIGEHPAYAQVLPLGISMHANYVRIS